MAARYTNAVGLLGLLAAATVFGQTPSGTPANPTSQPSDPGAASSPHQRTVTKTPTDESAAATSGTNPSDASTPHQKKALKKKQKAKKPTPPDSPAQ